MERADEKLIERTELTDEALEAAAGGWTFHRWFFKESSGSGDTGTNRVWFVTSHT